MKIRLHTSIVPKFSDTMFFWPLYPLCTLLKVPRNWKSVASFVGNQIKAKEDHLLHFCFFHVVF